MTTFSNTSSAIDINNTSATVILCCAGDLCPQLTGPTIIGNGHPCIVCQGIMHGGPCSDGMVEDPNGMTCKKCAAAKEKSTGGEGGGEVGKTGEEEDGSTATKEGSKDDEVLHGIVSSFTQPPATILQEYSCMHVFLPHIEKCRVVFFIYSVSGCLFPPW